MAGEDQTGSGVGVQRRSAGTVQTKRRKLHWPADRDFRILSLDGGGIKGLYEAAVLSRLEHRLEGRSIARHFDLVAGTSTGGIIALGLAAGLRASDILNLYLEHGGKIFPRRRNFGVFRSAFRAKPLAELLGTALGDKIIGEASVRLCIPSCEGKYGDVNIFKTPHHPDFKMDWPVPMKEVGLATSAAPTFLPAHTFGGYAYVDGGLWANNPAMVAVVDALTCFDILPEQIRMLSIGAGARDPQLKPLARHLGGLLSWGGDLIENFMQYASANADGQAGLLMGRDRMIRMVPEGPAALINMSDFEKAQAMLVPQGRTHGIARGEEIAHAFFETEVEAPTFYHGPRAVEGEADYAASQRAS